MFLCLSILSPFFHTSAPTDAASQRHHKVIYNDFPVFNYTYIYCHAPLCFYFSIFSLCACICVCVLEDSFVVLVLSHIYMGSRNQIQISKLLIPSLTGFFLIRSFTVSLLFLDVSYKGILCLNHILLCPKA